MIVRAAALAMLVVQPAVAQTPPAPPAATVIDADRLAAARELTKVLDMEKQYDLMLGQMIPLMTVQIFDGVKNNVQVPVAVRQKLSDAATLADAQRFFALDVSKRFKAQYPTLTEATAREYAVVFTADELRQLTAFYRTPLGQKTLALLPTIQRKIMPVGMKAGQEAGMAAMKATIDHLGLQKPATSS